MANKTLYIKPKDEAVVIRAAKLLAFYEDKALSTMFVEQCKIIADKYDQPTVQEGGDAD